MKPTDLLTVTQAADALGITARAVRYRISVGAIKAIKLGPATAAYVIDRAEIERAKERSPAA